MTLGGLLNGSWMGAGHQEKVRRIIKRASSLQKYIYHQGQNVGRNINVKDASVEISCGNEKHVSRH